MTEGPIFKNS